MATTEGLHTLPPEVLTYIVTFLPKTTLKSLRLVDRRLSFFASQKTFRKIHLLARDKDDHNCRHFMQLAKSDLSSFVREVTCNASAIAHDGVSYVEGPKTNFVPVFWDALPSLACFRNLRSLHVLFDTSFTTSELDYEPTDFRRRVLATIFRALARARTEVLQKTVRNAPSDAITYPTAHEATATPPTLPISPIPLSTLIISNLEDCYDPGLTDIPEFTTIMSGVRTLRLDVAQRKDPTIPATSMTAVQVPNQSHEMFTQLPHTWLSLQVAANLQVLSLYYESWWGWLPNVDFRLIGGGEGMPKLRTLALGHFVFSHQWQVDWITSLSLKELYLEECAVLAQYLDYPTPQEGHGTDGHESSNVTHFVGEMELNSLRWRSILFQIRSSMPTLRVFGNSTKPSLASLEFDVMREHRGDLSCRDLGLSIKEESNRFIREWVKSKRMDRSPDSEKFWYSVFRHYTATTPRELSLESDTPICTPDYQSGRYLAYRPAYRKEATYEYADNQEGELTKAEGTAKTDAVEAFLMSLMMKTDNIETARGLSMGPPVKPSEGILEYLKRIGWILL
ncbi:hypothetical protein ACHAPJ_010074 [Fusarium lateritium]